MVHPARRSAKLGLALGLSLCGLAERARALEPGSLNGNPVLVEISESGSVYYNFDNRDSRPSEVSTRANDDYGLFYNRLTLQATSGRVSAGVRADSVWFFAARDPTEIALELTDEAAPSDRAGYFRRKLNEAGLELSTRTIDWSYPAKYYLTFAGEKVEATLGDAGAQLGRGIVLSVRKQDELGTDTTVRGARLTLRVKTPLATRFTLLGGELNPLRIDEASGRYLGVYSGRDAAGAVAKAGMPRAIDADFTRLGRDCATSPSCTYAPDRVLAAQLEFSTASFSLATQGSLLLREAPLAEDVVRSARRLLTLSQSLNLPRIADHLSAYAELAFQRLDERENAPELDPGYGLYVSAAFAPRAFTLSFEGRHYRRLFPLLANVKVARAREFSSLAYNSVPTTEPGDLDTEFEGMNTCVSGGRLQGDVRLAPGVSARSAFAHYLTYAESSSNDACTPSSAAENRVSDVSSGVTLDSRDRSGHFELLLGARLDRAGRELLLQNGARSRLFYTETYLRHRFELALSPRLALTLTGRHRRRSQAEGGPGAPWLEGEEELGFDWAGHSSLAFGAEYDRAPGVPDAYFNIEVSHRPTPTTRVALFAGQRRGAQRCVGGTCRLYPPFEGVRLDFSARF